ncbi:hypothetical protein C3L57_08255, partial [Veillonellaceae bacterium M2-8]|nr:hypothetical protein [Veillonellaceae bacterium M2-8]
IKYFPKSQVIQLRTEPFSLSLYFLRFSNKHKKIHRIQSFPNNWYDYIKYVTTNELAIALHSTQASPRNPQPIPKPKPKLLRMDEEETSWQLKDLNPAD